MIWCLLRMVLTLLMLIITFIKLDVISENFENSVKHVLEERSNELNTAAFSFCTDFYNIYTNCGQKMAKKFCLNVSSIFECNMILFEATQTSSSLFDLIKRCNLMTLLNGPKNYQLYVNFGMVCHLFRLPKDEKADYFTLSLENLAMYLNIKIYLYIHDNQTIPEFFNHYVHIFDTYQRGYLSLSFNKKIIYRNLDSDCFRYGTHFKSKNHCLQNCERKYFNFNYYRYLYFDYDNVTMYSSNKNQIHKFCFESCSDRCLTYFFDISHLNKSLTSSNVINSKNKSDVLDVILQRAETPAMIHNLIINIGLLLLNIFTIIGFVIGFNLYMLVNILEQYSASQNSALKRWPISNRVLLVLMKCILLTGFFLHGYQVVKDCQTNNDYNTSRQYTNLFVENLTITICFNLSELLPNEQVKRECTLKNGDLNLTKLYLQSNLSSSLEDVVLRIEIYSEDHFKSKEILNEFLRENSEVSFYSDFKCWKINFDFYRITGTLMNRNILKYTKLNNEVKFIFDRTYDGIYLSEFNLYPKSRNFANRTFFSKDVTIFNEQFEGVKCFNYSEDDAKCDSRDECIADCQIRFTLEQYNIYPTNYKYLPLYSKVFQITKNTSFIHATKQIFNEQINSTCEQRFPLVDCRETRFEFRPSESPRRDDLKTYILDLGFHVKLEEINYSYQNVQYINYLTSLLFIYFGTSMSGLFGLLNRTMLNKLDLLKLLFIGIVIYVEFRQLIDLYLQKKLIYSLEFDTSDSINIPQVSICYKILEILKDKDSLDTNEEENHSEYFPYLNGHTKSYIDSITENLSELMHNITFLANDFGAYTTLTGDLLKSLEYHNKFNSLTLTRYLYMDYKCYGFELNFENHSHDMFDLDFVIRFTPATKFIDMRIYEQKFFIYKINQKFNQSVLIKFSPFHIDNRALEQDCEDKSLQRSSRTIDEISKQFFDGMKCVTTFLSVTIEHEYEVICNNEYASFKNEIIEKLNQREEPCECCGHYDFKITNLESTPFTASLSHSGFKFAKVYRLKLTLVELMTYLIASPSFLLGINAFKLIKLIWIKFLT